MCAPLAPPPPPPMLLLLRDGAPAAADADAGMAMPDWMLAMAEEVAADTIEGEREAEAGVDTAAKEDAADSDAADGDKRA